MKKIKHIFLVMIFSLTSFYSICAQDIAAQMDSIFMNLDLSTISSNYLYDKGVSFRGWGTLNGSLPLDSLDTTTKDDWFWHYTTLETARIDNSEPFTTLEEFINIEEGLENENSIPLTLLMLEFHRLKTNALEDSLIYAQQDGLYPNPNSSISPYTLDSVFIASSLSASVDSGNLQFVLPDSLILSNFPQMKSIDIDFQDNVGGYRKVTPDIPLSVIYDEVGTKQLTIKVTFTDGNIFYAKSRIDVTDINSEERVYSSTPDVPGIDLPLGGQMDIFYSDECNEMQKPLIYVEGFNPEGLLPTDWNIMTTKLDVSEGISGQAYDFPSGTQPTLWEQLSEEGYDLVFVDFGDGAGDILQNSLAVEDAIMRVNDLKSNGNSTVPTTIIAASMGGLVTYRALTQLEAQGYDHQVEDFISFDSPFRGANIPLGLQAFIKVFANTTIAGSAIGDRIPTLRTVEDVLNAPATRQLLYTSFALETGPLFNSLEHDAFQNTLFSLPPPDVNHIAIANGSGIGEGQVFDAGDLLMNISGNQPIDGVPSELQASLRFDNLSVFAVNNPEATDRTIYEQALSVCLLGCEISFPVLPGIQVNAPSTIYPYDSAPASVENYGLPARIGGLLQANLFAPDSIQWGFVPTVSALNIPGNPDPYTIIDPETCGGAPVTRCIFSQDDDVWSPFVAEGIHNQKHVSVNTNIITFFLTHFFTPRILGNTLDGISFNFGEAEEFPDNTPTNFKHWRTEYVIDKYVNIFHGGKLLVNDLNPIGYSSDDNLSTGENSFFRVDLVKSCTPPIDLHAFDGGSIQVGASGSNSTNKGMLVVNQFTTITIGADGVLDVNKDSELIIKSGGKVTIEDKGQMNLSYYGKVVVEDGGVLEFEPGARLTTPERGRIRVEEGGELILDESVQIDLNHWGSKIDIYGKLTIRGNFNFSGNGYFKFHSTHELNLLHDWHFKGSGKSNTAIFLGENTTVDFGDHGFQVEHAEVLYDEDSRIKIGNQADLRATYCTFIGHEDAATTSWGFDLADIGKVDFIGCLFQDLDVGANITNTQDPIKFTVTTFSNMNSVSVGIGNCKAVSSLYCTYDGNSNTLFGMLLENIDLVRSHLDVFKNYDTGTAIIAHDVDAVEFRTSTIENCENGFFSPANHPSNVMFMSGSIVQNNTIGVHIEKGFKDGTDVHGLVLADCSKFINNTTAIKGEDVDLQLDAVINAGGNFDETSPNHFVGNVLDIDVCYDDFDTGVVFLRGNYWDTDGVGPININRKSSAGECDVPMAAILTAPLETDATIGCYTGPPGPPVIDPPVKCDLKVDSSNPKSNSTYNEYGEGYSYYRNEDYAEAFVRLDRSASIPNVERDPAADACRHYIDVSRALVKANENGAYDLLIANKQEESILLNQVEVSFKDDKREVTVYPNPTTGSITIIGLEKASTVHVFDPMGRLIEMFEKVEDNQTLSTNWPSGMYILKISTNDNLIQTKRLIVH